jgi:hypothetical protein
VVQPVYATPEDLAEALGVDTPPAGAEAWLRRASRDLDAALIGAVYEVDEATQMPTDPDLVEAFRDACCEQASFLIDGGDATGAKAKYQTVAIGQVSYGRRAGAAGDDVRVGPRALDILRLAGLRVVVRSC